MNYRSWPWSVLSSGLVAFAIPMGCIGPESNTGSLTSDESVEEASQPLAEAGCATASITAGHGATITWTSSSTYRTAASPGDKYNPSGCPNQFIVEISGMQNDGDPIELDWFWDQPLPLTQTECTGWLQAGIYGLNSGVWSLLSTGRQTLSWNSTFSECDLVAGLNPYSMANAAYDPTDHEKIRVAVTAFAMPEGASGRYDYKFVRVDAHQVPQ